MCTRWSRKKFKKLGMDPDLESVEAINRAMVVIDCTPKGVGIENKNELYLKLQNNVKVFSARK